MIHDYLDVESLVCYNIIRVQQYNLLIMTKKIINAPVEQFSPGNLEGSLKDLKEQIQAWIDSYSEDTVLDYKCNYYYEYENDSTPMMFLNRDRLETDKEYERRLAQEAEMAQWQEKRDRQEFERLQKKFGQ